MKLIKTPIIPIHPTLVKVEGQDELDYEAICAFAAIGFFLDTDTYWKNKKVLRPASNHEINSHGYLKESKSWFQWHSSPRDISFDQALEEYTHLFEAIIMEQTKGKKVILPLSGGLDSRTQAAALKYIDADVFSFSYEFENGYNETKIAKKIARACNFEFKSYQISKGYLWQTIDELVELNRCYSDFTSPRQMAIQDQFSEMGNLFSLGHWGDVLFDSMNLKQLSSAEEVDVVFKKLIKKGGIQVGTDLWEFWNLNGSFEAYLKHRISSFLEQINIEDSNAKIRAFKSKYWAPRWTSVNLSIYEAHHPITMPYYDDRMCEFICTIPEAFLKNRQLQIAYIKSRSPELAKIEWQDQRPFNLNNFKYNRYPYNLPYKIVNKLKRKINTFSGNSYVQRNWELQFLGNDNQKEINQCLYNNGLNNWISEELISKYFTEFYKKDHLQNAHAINILLVLSKFNQFYSS